MNEETDKVTCTTVNSFTKEIVIAPLTWEELKEKYRRGEVQIVVLPKKVGRNRQADKDIDFKLEPQL